MADNQSASHEASAMNTDEESDNAAHEVEMEYEDPPLPEIEAPSRPNNRRARVEEDEDDDRDRRHPTHRMNNPPPSSSTRHTMSRSSTSTSSASNRSAQPSQSSTSEAHAQSGPAPAAGPNPHHAAGGAHRAFPLGGIAISIDLETMPFGAGPAATAGAGAQATGADAAGARAAGADGFADFFNNPNFLSELFGLEPDVDDPDRADKLLNGLEEVPLGLVRRLDKVGGIGSTGNDLSGGDSGCAVCWEPLLDSSESVDDEDDAVKAKQKGKEGEVKIEQRRIVALPCAHVFHAECLRPWFSRPKQTTCPTCRFNIDPENLTYTSHRQRQRRAQEQSNGPASQGEVHPPSVATAIPVPVTPLSTAASTSTTAADETRGRDGISTGPPPRRAGSEPPLNRVPRPAAHPEPAPPLNIPGFPGHFVFVSPPIRLNAQGQPIHTPPTGPTESGTSRPARDSPQPQPQNGPSSGSYNTAHQTSPTPSASRPTFGPPPPPSTNQTLPEGLFANLGIPPGGIPNGGIIALDIRFPLPATFFGGAGPQPAPQTPAPQPRADAQNSPQQPAPASAGTPPTQGAAPNGPNRIRIPTGGVFAGLNFGNAGQPQAVRASDLLRAVFDAMPQNAQNANAAPAPSQAPPASDRPTPASAEEAHPPPPSTAATENATPPPSSAGTAPADPGAGDGARPNNDAAFLRFLSGAMSNPSTLLRLLLSAGLMSMGAPGFAAGAGRPGPTNTGPKKEWSPPPAPGLSLRQRVEKREREAGLRCSDVSCGIGPSDEEPYISDADAAAKKVRIHAVGDESHKICDHTFHPSCLVSAERVALRGADPSIVGNDVEVTCPVCRGSGSIFKADWDDGVHVFQ